MQCLILSDSHSHGENIGKALRKCPDAEVVFYLGDGISALDGYIERYRDKAWFFVLGNCDRPECINGSFVKKVDTITLCKRKIVLTHGDLYGAKYGVGGLISLAKESGADIILFGHTHKRLEYYDSQHGIWLFNPGALENSWDTGASFGLLTLNEKGDALFSHGSL